MITFYKVVTQDNYSCSITNPFLRLKYQQGMIVSPPMRTIGVLAFITIKYAEYFMNKINFPGTGSFQQNNFKIKRVECREGEAQFPTKMTPSTNISVINYPGNINNTEEPENLDELLTMIERRFLNYGESQLPPGTICLRSCRVID